MIRNILPLLILSALVNSEKPFLIDMLAVLSYSAPPDRITTCIQAAQLATNIANSQTDILPDYKIFLNIKEQTQGTAYNAPTLVVNYSRTFERSDGLYSSPIIIGPTISNGCKATGTFMHYLNYLSFSTACSATILANHDHYPNLFLTIPTANAKNYGYVRFIKEIGKWRRCALLIYADNINNYDTSISFHQIAVSQGIDISWFNSVLNFDMETALSLKKSEARIIVAITSSADLVTTFFCRMYRVGITGSRYVFFVYDTGLPNLFLMPDVLPDGCRKYQVQEQMKYTFWMGNMDDNADVNQKCLFGYSKTQYEAMFDAFTNSSRKTDYAYRFVCHDVVMQAVVTLDHAETKLKQQNLSLRSFSAQPKRVVEAVRESVLEVDFKGLRAPRVRYDNRGELYGIPNFILYWNATIYDFQKVFQVSKLEDTKTYDYESYRVRQINPVSWLTPDGQPPKDRKTVVGVVLETPLSALITTSTFALLLTGFQVACMFLLLRRASTQQRCRSRLKCLGLFGCVLLNFTSLPFVFWTSWDQQVIWHLRIFQLIISLSIINGVVALMAVCYCSKLTAYIREYPISCRTARASQFIKMFIKTQPRCFCLIAGFVALNGIILTGWLAGDPINICLSQMANTFYDEVADVQYEKYMIVCYSSKQRIWICIFLVMHLVLLFVGGIFVFKVPQKKRMARRCPDFIEMAAGLVNNTSVLLASILISVLLSNPVDQQLAVACLSLVLSLGVGLCFSTSLARRYILHTYPSSAQVTKK